MVGRAPHNPNYCIVHSITLLHRAQHLGPASCRISRAPRELGSLGRSLGSGASSAERSQGPRAASLEVLSRASKICRRRARKKSMKSSMGAESEPAVRRVWPTDVSR